MRIEFIPETDSTNTEMKRRIAADSVSDGLLLYAGRQTAGRGQRGNSWESREGEGLYATMVMHPTSLPVEELPAVVMACALAVADVVDVLIGRQGEARIKWPNDILVKGGKIAGVLVETGIRGDLVHELILGFGINLNQLAFSDSFSTEAVSVQQITGSGVDVHRVAELMHKVAVTGMTPISLPEHRKQIARDYHARLFGKGESCLFQSESETISGILIEIDRVGRARVSTNSGEQLLSHPAFRFAGIKPDAGQRSAP
jgi:BirA family biotin operon repressor/biotin-[acetyl-CoA-carboxylase] ligase